MRVTAVNDVAIGKGDHVLYWMIAARRSTWNFALDHALARAKECGRPLIVLEPLRVGYQWASDRFHAFVMQGMADNAAAFAKAGIAYHAYVEREPGDDKGLLEALAKKACVVVTDEQPGFFLPRMIASAAKRLAVRVEMVDGNGILPLRASGAFSTAMAFRRHFQKTSGPHLLDMPHQRLGKHATADIPGAVLRKWPSGMPDLAKLPIDHAIPPVAYKGGSKAAQAQANAFFADRFARYADERNGDAPSGLSPYLHFGHISSHALVHRALTDHDWDPSRLGKANGKREGWWGLPNYAESFLDELITWRELGYGFCHHRADYDQYASLPDWAQATLTSHAKDPRPYVYSLAELDAAETHDEIWNAAQRQLVVEGRIHNYLRMLWGKKILEWSKTPQAALAVLIELNNKYAVDGRDPNSYSGIFWTLGRFDRPWGPIRPIFGTIRYMSSDATRKKLDLSDYLKKHRVPLGRRP